MTASGRRSRWHTTPILAKSTFGIAISQFDYEAHSDAQPGGLRSLKSWWASHVRLVHVR